MDEFKEIRVSQQEDEANPAYWLDACEDVSDEILNSFADFDPATAEVVDDQGVDPLFFGGIDSILENIKNGGTLSVISTETGTINNDNVAMDSNVVETCSNNVEIQNGDISDIDRVCEKDLSIRKHVEVEKREENGGSRYENGNGEVKRERVYDSGDSRKRARVSDYDERRSDSGRRSSYSKDARDELSRKRYRDYEDVGRRDRDRDRDRSAKRGRYPNDRRDNRDLDSRERERRGYWERDRSGKLTYHAGSWEAEYERETKRAMEENLEKINAPEKKPEEKKGKPVEEMARKYQLDVLEQAKKKNTIAFLETGAGKTLIAVLLIKSVCRDMLEENRKMLAIFLVPKVPLVYQQAEVIREGTGYKVGHYCGEMGQDFWDARRWQREFESKQLVSHLSRVKTKQ